MEKIALFTFLKSYNYGTLFQAYALSRVITKLGRECEYIDFVKCAESKGIRHLASKIKKKLANVFATKKNEGIDDFSFWKSDIFKQVAKKCDDFRISFIPQSLQYTPSTIRSTNRIYERFIVGSDQTWSPNIIDSSSPFLLGFVEDARKKYSYAPSLGTISIPDTFKDVLRNSLSSFSLLSCRERTNCESLSKLLRREVSYVLDPTLLLDKNEWLEISLPYKNLPERFVLCYILGEKDCISRFAEELGAFNGLPVIYIMTRPYYLSKKNVLTDVGPREFLTILSKAAYLVTDSFHGTVFSVNFSIPFFTFTKRENSDTSKDNDRIKEILSEFNLLSRFCKDNAVLQNADSKMSFEFAQFKLTELRETSLSFLRKVINE